MLRCVEIHASPLIVLMLVRHTVAQNQQIFVEYDAVRRPPQQGDNLVENVPDPRILASAAAH